MATTNLRSEVRPTDLIIGITGFSAQKFDVDKAQEILRNLFGLLKLTGKNIIIVSGLTNLGIPGLAYSIADEFDFELWGIASKKAFEFPRYPVDRQFIMGDNWGDESQDFLNSLDVLVRLGGGKQAHAEAQAAKERGLVVLEFDLEAFV